jgi:4-hydroxy-3-methylbut-2-enyl diphosphate reductase
LVELCERKFKTYFISSASEIISSNEIKHYDYPNKITLTSSSFLPDKPELKIIITSGASCPDSALDAVIHKINSLRDVNVSNEKALEKLTVYEN